MIISKLKTTISISLFITIALSQTINVQGVLRDPLGKTVEDGYYNLTLKLYEQETGGMAIWQENQTSIYTVHGLFTLDLGSVNSLENVPFNTSYFLGISVENDPEMDPRLKLLKVPNAMSLVGTQNMIPSQGNAGIGTTTPQVGLHIVSDGEGDDLLKVENVGSKAVIVDPTGDVVLGSDAAINFEDGSELVSANFGGR